MNSDGDIYHMSDEQKLRLEDFYGDDGLMKKLEPLEDVARLDGYLRGRADSDARFRKLLADRKARPAR